MIRSSVVSICMMDVLNKNESSGPLSKMNTITQTKRSDSKTRKTITCATCYIRPCFILVNANIEWPIKHAFSCIYV